MCASLFSNARHRGGMQVNRQTGACGTSASWTWYCATSSRQPAWHFRAWIARCSNQNSPKPLDVVSNECLKRGRDLRTGNPKLGEPSDELLLATASANLSRQGLNPKGGPFHVTRVPPCDVSSRPVQWAHARPFEARRQTDRPLCSVASSRVPRHLTGLEFLRSPCRGSADAQKVRNRV